MNDLPLEFLAVLSCVLVIVVVRFVLTRERQPETDVETSEDETSDETTGKVDSSRQKKLWQKSLRWLVIGLVVLTTMLAAWWLWGNYEIIPDWWVRLTNLDWWEDQWVYLQQAVLGDEPDERWLWFLVLSGLLVVTAFLMIVTAGIRKDSEFAGFETVIVVCIVGLFLVGLSYIRS